MHNCNNYSWSKSNYDLQLKNEMKKVFFYTIKKKDKKKYNKINMLID